jgi:hypothetical protein
MAEQPGVRREKKVKLVASRGETSVFIDAEIDEQGSLVVSGQDIGKAPKDWFGHDAYEYWLVVAASEKDRVLSILLGQLAGGEQLRPASNASQDEKDWALLSVIEKMYGGDQRVIEALSELLKANGISYKFSTY